MVDNAAFIAGETAARHDEAIKGGKTRTVSTDGEIADGYQIVKDVFIENFVGKREHHGAALAVYHKGKLVVDLWGGVADRVGGKQWNKNTYASIFCCTKSLAAICMAMKVDRGECSYTDKVTKYWPEFGRNDKNDITIEMILTHRAGLPNFDADFTLAEVTPEKISKIIEAESPKYMPGTKTSYHAITYGWLIDQLFCRIDKRQRSISDFFHDEIQKKHGVEVSVGTSPELEEQTAKFPPVTKRITLRDYIHDRKIFSISNYLKKSTKEISRMRLKNEVVEMFNDPEIRLAAQPAISGIATARGLAQTYKLFMKGTLVSKQFLKQISEPQFVNEFDHALGCEESKGYGFVYYKSSTGSWQIGHPAIGGQRVYMDPANKLVVCYLTNGMKTWMRSALIAFGLFATACVAFAEQKKDKTELSVTGVAVLDKLRALRKEGELALEALEDDKDQDAISAILSKEDDDQDDDDEDDDDVVKVSSRAKRAARRGRGRGRAAARRRANRRRHAQRLRRDQHRAARRRHAHARRHQRNLQRAARKLRRLQRRG